MINLMNQQLEFNGFLKYSKYKKHRILIVDDEEFCLSSMMSVFQICGVNVEFEVDFCVSGEDAVKQVQDCYREGI